jgi:hypothetical protein
LGFPLISLKVDDNMIIANARIGMVAQQEYREEHSVSEHLEFWLDRQIPVASSADTELPKPKGVEVDLSRTGSLLALHRQSQTLDLNTPMDARARLNMMIIDAMYRAVSGKEFNVSAPPRSSSDNKIRQLNLETSAPAQIITSRSGGPGLVYQRNERYQEQETLRFQAAGVVRTADGREIDFSVALNMSREFVQESNLQVGAGSQKIDPLVINFDGLGASLSQTRFEFDLDSDGTAEQIATLRPGSGYLALDRNGDGIINNGSELFGPSSGRGFAELAAYDEDGNNFIDEGDSIYHQLRIWMTNDDGSTQLAALGDKNIGAIFLGHVSSPFQLKDAQNNLLGEVVNSGLYLTEDGKTGVVQEINLTV